MSRPAAVPPLQFTTPSARELRTERILNAPRERVWRALTEPDQLAQWWGRGNELHVEKLDLVPGGTWRFVEHTPDGAYGFQGEYHEIVPPERLVNTFAWDGARDQVVHVTLTLEDLGDGRTRLVSLSLFPTEGARDAMLGAGMSQGMAESYAALDALLERG